MDAGGLTIRLARSDDAPSIAALYVQAAEEARDREPTHFQRPDPKIVEEHYADLAPSQDRLLLAAEAAGGVVGFVEARRITRPPGVTGG